MKAKIHPQNYRLVVFQDLNNETSFLMKSTIATKETTKYKDGQTYPFVKLHVTSASHPFYTGLEKMIDIEGRVDRFKIRKKAAQAAQQTLQNKSAKSLKRSKQQPKVQAPSIKKISQKRPPTQTNSFKNRPKSKKPPQTKTVSKTKDSSTDTKK